MDHGSISRIGCLCKQSFIRHPPSLCKYKRENIPSPFNRDWSALCTSRSCSCPSQHMQGIELSIKYTCTCVHTQASQKTSGPRMSAPFGRVVLLTTIVNDAVLVETSGEHGAATTPSGSLLAVSRHYFYLTSRVTNLSQGHRNLVGSALTYVSN